jgi:hypothetical protein
MQKPAFGGQQTSGFQTQQTPGMMGGTLGGQQQTPGMFGQQ